jgi:hypothetical protein
MTTPTPWSSAYRPIPFGINTPTLGYPWLYSGVTSVNGKAQFTSSGLNVYGTPPCKFLWMGGGTYEGFHIIKSIDGSGNILTNTDYNGTASGTDGFCLVNYIFRIHYGWPTQDKMIDVRTAWKVDGTLITDISAYLAATFKIVPPIPGYDENLYTHYRVQVVPAADFLQFLNDNSLDPDLTVAAMLLYDWTDASNKWYVLNGTVKNFDLNANYTGPSAVLAEGTPVVFSGQQTIFTKILQDRVYNVLTTAP